MEIPALTLESLPTSKYPGTQAVAHLVLALWFMFLWALTRAKKA